MKAKSGGQRSSVFSFTQISQITQILFLNARAVVSRRFRRLRRFYF
ncbi:hypothetical protein [Candidatus Cloacimonas acidaminovorans]|nr:hypothetical protein [Candidatus Cloacimonas acidaminovorans]